MAAEKLSMNKELREDEALQKKLEEETADRTWKKLEQERDEAMEKLTEFQLVSRMVIEEVSAIQEDLEIEKMCRESAEALASKLKRENHSLKRKSMMLISYLSPETIKDINLDEEEQTVENEETRADKKEEHEALDSAASVCLSSYCTSFISELQNNLKLTLEEKNQVISDLEVMRQQLKNTCDELMKEKHNNKILIAENLQQKKLLEKYTRVSQFAVAEYEALQNTLDLEQNLRMEAENIAREMLVEQTQLKRQSQILLQSCMPGQALQDILSQVAILTEDMKKQRLEHQNQMEEKLKNCEAQKELTALRHKLELLEEEKKECSIRCFKAEQEVKDLQFIVEKQKKLQADVNPPTAPPPPPPPLPPSATEPASNPLSSLLALIRKRRNISKDILLVDQDSAKVSGDIQHQALEEMMQRIKKGIQLRPVNQSPNRGEQKTERLPSNSAIQELKGIMVMVL
ncbi:shootin-1 isoform X2 [Girardinichthys multiradiatus]|uniref:shootin-1 isoform X2 n=1 Tax=Girardinichthys multiradiatus TaxID=208333 RepID=UPI001FAB4DC8|nr:shootin-1 isoform X2 [Girardinichthys multiradiatus]